MASQCQIAKSKKVPKYMSRIVHRCSICGRSRSYLRKFALCRLCFRKLALEGHLPGVRKASW